jgi:hypothetical protein
MKAGFAGRIFSAAIIVILGIAISGTGTALAASVPRSSQRAHISIAVLTDPNMQVKPGDTITDDVVVTNNSWYPANDVAITVPFNAGMLKLIDVTPNRTSAWVTSASSNNFQAYVGRLSSHGESVSLTARFTVLPGYTPGDAINSTIVATWSDRSGNGTNETPVALLPSLSGNDAALVRANPVAVVNDTVQFFSAAFTPGETVTFWMNTPDGKAMLLYVYDGKLTTETTSSRAAGNKHMTNNAQYLFADADGVINTSLSVKGMPRGFYSIVGHGHANGHETVIPFMMP